VEEKTLTAETRRRRGGKKVKIRERGGGGGNLGCSGLGRRFEHLFSPRRHRGTENCFSTGIEFCGGQRRPLGLRSQRLGRTQRKTFTAETLRRREFRKVKTGARGGGRGNLGCSGLGRRFEHFFTTEPRRGRLPRGQGRGERLRTGRQRRGFVAVRILVFPRWSSFRFKGLRRFVGFVLGSISNLCQVAALAGDGAGTV
jgi:hypothetical protein